MEDVRLVVLGGEVIEDYPRDVPYPSRLVLAWIDGRAVHAVVAIVDARTAIVITVYEPDPDEWDETFRRRR